MTTRTLAIVSAAVIGTPLLAAAVLTICSPTVAVIVCLAVAAAGAVGTAVGVRQISAALPATKCDAPSGKCQVDTETNDAICIAVAKLNGGARNL
jgi:hypothetical protein